MFSPMNTLSIAMKFSEYISSVVTFKKQHAGERHNVTELRWKFSFF